MTNLGVDSASRLALWERKLLDLSLRNALLNFRAPRAALPLLTPSAVKLEDALASGADFSLEALAPEESAGTDGEGTQAGDAAEDEERLHERLEQAFRAGKITTALSQTETAARTVRLYRAARTALEENGANTLYFALGFLCWYESDAAGAVPRRAPVLLLPAEIVRRSAAAGGYRVRLRDEETVINVTLLEMLRTSFGIEVPGIDPLPGDEHGVDAEAVFAAVRQAVRHKKRWTLEETAALGIFSFSRFIMWNDLRSRTGELGESDVARSLESGRLEWTPDARFDDAGKLDSIPPEQFFPLLSADSSQLAAVHAAVQGKSFVLHGPPGTGKSQTIVNMIAAALWEGRTVLFIAEKQAALSVVQHRLEQMGLGTYALPLHSNKTRKRDVLDALSAALESPRTKDPAARAETARRLEAQRDARNSVIRAMHRTYPCGLSLYDAIALCETYKEYPGKLRFSPGMPPERLTREGLARWRELAGQVRAAGEMTGTLSGHPLGAFTRVQYTQSLRGELEQVLEDYGDALRAFGDSARMFEEKLGFSAENASFEELSALVNAARILPGLGDMPQGLVAGGELVRVKQEFVSVSVSGRRRDALRAQLLERYTDGILDYDAEKAAGELAQAEKSWFMKKALVRRHVLGELRAFAREPAAFDAAPEAVSALLRDLGEYRTRAQEVHGASGRYADVFGALWNGEQPDWNLLERTLEQAHVLAGALKLLCEDCPGALDRMSREAGADRDGWKSRMEAAQTKLCREFDRISDCAQRLTALAGVDPAAMLGVRPWLPGMRETVRGWSDHLGELRDWSSWLTLRRSLRAEGLGSFADALEQGRLSPDEMPQTLEHSFGQALAEAITAAEPALQGFTGQMFEEKLAAYRKTEKEYEELARAALLARLAERVPEVPQNAADSSEAAILRRAVRSGGRGLSIRRLFSQLPHLLPRLAPCMLMSPISAAQYIDPAFPKFDLVIFDEASQMPTCEAIGAIARGRSLVVVGDPRQLPPTSFFDVQQEETDDGDTGVTDLESVLDDCMALGMPQTALRWHYRSRHESLIAFSNRRFYDGGLYTFPSPDDPESRVRFVQTRGVYDRAGTRQNAGEAEAVVEELVRRLEDPRTREQSLGVVTFSRSQQVLIEDMLSARLAQNAQLFERSNAGTEPLFVKNLENVQGDERDVILFSVGYGPDAAGQMSYNFGPVNRDGGWRRLNVAASRARQEMIVYASFDPSGLREDKLTSDGARALRDFLLFARDGSRALVGAGEKPEALAQAVADALRSIGYEARADVGTSEFRVDVGVVHPEHPGLYVLGILLDGPHAAQGTANDCEIVQEEQLERLGWTIHHVHALDWWENPDRELLSIRTAVRRALSRTATETHPEPPESPTEAPEKPPVSECRQAPEHAGGESAHAAHYRAVRLEPVREGTGDSAELLQPRRAETVKAQIRQVLEAEAPIERGALVRRVLTAWGIARTGTRIERRMDELIAQMEIPVTHAGERTFLWRADQDSRSFDAYRVSDPADADRRAAEDIAPQEIAAAARDIVRHQLSLSRADLERSTGAAFGIARLSQSALGYIREGIALCITHGDMTEENGRVSITNA